MMMIFSNNKIIADSGIYMNLFVKKSKLKYYKSNLTFKDEKDFELVFTQ